MTHKAKVQPNCHCVPLEKPRVKSVAPRLSGYITLLPTQGRRGLALDTAFYSQGQIQVKAQRKSISGWNTPASPVEVQRLGLTGFQSHPILGPKGWHYISSAQRARLTALSFSQNSFIHSFKF